MSSFDIVDLHAHILPGADHGSSSLETSIKQLMLAKSYGVTRVVATPHFYPHRHTLQAFLKRRELAYNLLTEALLTNMPEVKLGAEVLLCEGLENLVGIDKLCISGTNVLLLELPFSDFNSKLIRTVERLIAMGYSIVLAHADRYNPKDIESLVSVGAKIQLNADSISTLFKNKTLYNWAERGIVVALGSDIHRANRFAYKYFKKASKKFTKYISGIKEASDKIWSEAE